jgi:predicted MFS family arabinose efflux permease
MQFLKTDARLVGPLVVLAVAQVIGWGTIGLPAIVGRQIAADLQIDVAAAFAGTSVLYAAMGLCAPALGAAFVRFGARRVMMAGATIAAPGFVLLAVSYGPAVYFLGWAILGVAGSASLSTAAYIMLNEIAGRNAKSAIGALMLVTGLSSSIFWPTTSFLAGLVGWRGVCLVYAAMMVLVCLPLYAYGLPRRPTHIDQAPSLTPSPGAAPLPQSTFYLVVSTLALNAFVTFGLSAVFVELLKAEGLSPSDAVTFGSMLGIVQVSARAVDFLGGGRWDGITTGLFAGATLPAAMLVLMAGNGSYWTVALFILLYGLGSGALAVARATMPLVFYDKTEFAKASSRIALPLNLTSALAPPILVGLLGRFGSSALLGLAMLCSCTALIILVTLGRRRPEAAAIAATSQTLS